MTESTAEVERTPANAPAFRRVLLKLSGEDLMGELSYGTDPARVQAIARDLADIHRRGVEIADTHEYVTMRQDAWLELGEILLTVGRHREGHAALARSREIAERKGSTAVVARIDVLLAAEPATP